MSWTISAAVDCNSYNLWAKTKAEKTPEHRKGVSKDLMYLNTRRTVFWSPPQVKASGLLFEIHSCKLAWNSVNKDVAQVLKVTRSLQ